MHDLNELNYFAQVVKHGGFAPASRATGIPKSRLSRRVAELEKRLGVALLHRNTRHVSLTDIGRAYFEHCRAMLVEAEAAQDIVDCSIAEPRGSIRMSCPPALLCFLVAAELSAFMARYPRINVVVESTGRRVDVLKEGFDLAIRVRFPPIEDSRLHARTLSNSPQQLMAAPSLFDIRPRAASPDDLSSLPSLDWERPGQGHTWLLDGPDGTTVHIDHQPRLVTDDLITLRRAALAGLGIVQLPWMISGPDVNEGTLVEVLPEWAPRGGVIQAVFPSRRALLPAVKALIDFLDKRFADQDFRSQ